MKVQKVNELLNNKYYGVACHEGERYNFLCIDRKNSFTDEIRLTYNYFTPFKSIKEAEKYLKWSIKKYKRQKQYYFFIFKTNSKKHPFTFNKLDSDGTVNVSTNLKKIRARKINKLV